jgi:hypothetical protein
MVETPSLAPQALDQEASAAPEQMSLAANAVERDRAWPARRANSRGETGQPEAVV